MAEEGVFQRPGTQVGSASQGELVDRLMAKIAELETRLYQKELASTQQAAAHAGKRTNPVNHQLLNSLGDLDKQSAGDAKKDWLASVPSWITRSSLARSAMESLTTAVPTAQHVHAGSANGSAGNSQTAQSVDGSTTRKPGRQSPAPASAGTPAVADGDAIDDETQAAALPPRQQAAAALQDLKQNSRSPRLTAEGSFTASPGTHSSNTKCLTSQHNADLNREASWRNSVNGSSTHSATQPKWRSSLKQYYRYYLTGDDGDESDDTSQRVQEAAGAALAEANERLMEAELRVQAAEAAQQQLQQQLAAAEQLAAEVEQLKAENLEAWRVKYELEGQTAAYKASLEGLQREGGSMQQELQDLRKQCRIWDNVSSSEVEKLKAESQLLNSQLAQRSSELSTLRQQLTEAESERDRALQEKQQVPADRDKLLSQMQEFSSLQQQLAAATAAAASASTAAAGWEEKFMKERAVRRHLHEQLQVLRGNIRVLCRVRPPLLPSPTKSNSIMPNGLSGGSNSSSCISFPLEGLLAVHDFSTARQREFEFDAVFAPSATQEQVFEEVSPLVRSCADGYNVCIFAYGQTGSGKTYTMEGPHDNPGINTRALQELFSIAAEEVDRSWSFSVGMIEIYNEAVHDLLAMAAAPAAAGAQNLDVSGLPAGELPANMDRVQNLVWRKVSNVQEVQAALRAGSRGRATAATALNAASSRSHALVSVKVSGVREGKQFTAMLHLVDLAGSERVDRSEVTGQQLREAQAINKSLSALGDVVAALQRRNAHIPFRNSKLTQVLQDSLCGSSKVLLVCNLSPEPASCSETLSSLNFASRAAQVELGQARRTPAAAGGINSNNNAAEGVDGSSGVSASGYNDLLATAAATGGRNSPSPTKAAGLRTSLTGPLGGATGGGGSSGRPASRASDRVSGASTGLAAGTPRIISNGTAKPARH